MPLAARAALLFAALAAASPAAVDNSADSPKELAMALAKKAARAEKSGADAQAYIYYSEAAALQPANPRYKAKMGVLQTRAARQSKPTPPPAGPSDASTAPELKPEEVFDNFTARELADARELTAVPTLQAKPGKRDFDLSGDARALFTKVADAFGLGIVFDGDYPTTGAQQRFRIDGIDYREALHDLEAITGSFVVPVSRRVVMVARDTPQKRTEIEQTMLVAVPIPEVLTAQEVTEVAQVIRQTLNIEKIAWDSAQSRLVLRDRVSRVLPAVAVLQQLLSYRPEVVVDLEFMQVASSDVRNYGFTLTNNFIANYLGSVLGSVASAPSGVGALFSFGGGRTLIGLGVAQAEAMFNLTRSNSNSLYEAQLRSSVGQAATLHIGEKYPVITGGYYGGVAAAQATGTTYSPPPQFTYENLGLEMKVTPFVHGTQDITLTVETSFEVLTGDSVNSIPIIGRRELKSQIRLRANEWAVVGGLMNQTKSKGVDGFAGLAQLPFVGELFRQTAIDNEESTVLIAMRPRLLSLPPDQIVTHALRVGPETKPFSIL